MVAAAAIAQDPTIPEYISRASLDRVAPKPSAHETHPFRKWHSNHHFSANWPIVRRSIDRTLDFCTLAWNVGTCTCWTVWAMHCNSVARQIVRNRDNWMDAVVWPGNCSTHSPRPSIATDTRWPATFRHCLRATQWCPCSNIAPTSAVVRHALRPFWFPPAVIRAMNRKTLPKNMHSMPTAQCDGPILCRIKKKKCCWQLIRIKVKTRAWIWRREKNNEMQRRFVAHTPPALTMIRIAMTTKKTSNVQKKN